MKNNNFDVDKKNITTYDENGNLNEGVEILSLDSIIPNPDQPRKNFDDNALEELAVSIKNLGIIQPIVVRPIGGGKYQIVAGERRYRASKLANMPSIPVIKKFYTDKQLKQISLTENIQRQDLNPIEEAQAYKTLIDDYNLTQEQLADQIGKSRPAVANSLRLLTLNPVVKDMVINGRISAGHAKALTSIKDYVVQHTYALACCDKQLSVRQLELMVKNYLKSGNEKEKTKNAVPQITVELKDLANIMQRKFGTKVNAVGNNNKGRIYIDYYSTADLDRIFEILEKIN